MFTSLQKRLAAVVLLPLTLLLVSFGFAGFQYARSTLMDEWKESSLLKLQRAAHQINMRLQRPVEWMSMFQRTGGRGNQLIQQWLLEQLKQLDGVKGVNLTWNRNAQAAEGFRNGNGMGMGTGMGAMQFDKRRPVTVSAPLFNLQQELETVSLTSEFFNEDGAVVGTLEVAMSFHHLMEEMLASSWWQANKACLVDSEGRYLAHTGKMDHKRKVLGGTGDQLELDVLKAMSAGTSGMVMGPGVPPSEVSGFHRLAEAPWTIIIFAPGGEILRPIIRFRNYYFLFGAFCILVVVFFIRFAAGGTVRTIQEISESAHRVAEGDYGESLPVKSRDEIGRLTRSFNVMLESLKQQEYIRTTFGRYVDREVAEKLLCEPESAYASGEKRSVVIMMSDLREFTALCELLDPAAIRDILNRYFTYLIDIIQRHEGIIVDFVGDAILAFFDPLDLSVDAQVRKAVRCAQEMQGVMERFNAEQKTLGLPKLKMGIGINVGEVVVGTIGSSERAKYGIVGAAVNLTQRVQSTAGPGEVVVTDAVLRSLGDQVEVKRSAASELKGVQGTVTLHVLEEPHPSVQ